MSIYEDIISDYKNKDYKSIVNNTIVRYNEMYYNKPLNSMQIELLLSPSMKKLTNHIIK